MSVRGKTVAPVVVVAALAAAGQAMACGAAVRITANGPAPARVSVTANDPVFWLGPASSARTEVRFADLPCSISLPFRPVPVGGVIYLVPPGCYDVEKPRHLAEKLGMTDFDSEVRVRRWVRGKNRPNYAYTLMLLDAAGLLGKPQKEKA